MKASEAREIAKKGIRADVSLLYGRIISHIKAAAEKGKTTTNYMVPFSDLTKIKSTLREDGYSVGYYPTSSLHHKELEARLPPGEADNQRIIKINW